MFASLPSADVLAMNLPVTISMTVSLVSLMAAAICAAIGGGAFLRNNEERGHRWARLAFLSAVVTIIGGMSGVAFMSRPVIIEMPAKAQPKPAPEPAFQTSKEMPQRA